MRAGGLVHAQPPRRHEAGRSQFNMKQCFDDPLLNERAVVLLPDIGVQMARQRGPMRPDVPVPVRAFQNYYDVGIAARASILCIDPADDDRGACCGMSGVGARGPLAHCPGC
eukprot:3873772-Alexandrium_andersonii.AAC.1